MYDRLREIEQHATVAWEETLAALVAYGVPTAFPWDMRVAATALTGGPVDPCPNLINAVGERLAGLLEGTIDRPQILFEAFDPLARQRFSIAHELGHFTLHAHDAGRGRAFQRCTQPRVDPPASPESAIVGETAPDEEAEADAFAGAFLMPATNLRADLAQFGRSVAFLAERYAVSEAALRRRLATLDRLVP